MPLYAVIGRDGPDGLALRKEHRADHLAGLEPLLREGRMRFGGPLRGEDGNPCGSVMIFEAASLDAARAIAARDPYVTRGIFASYEVFETAEVVPRAPAAPDA